MYSQTFLPCIYSFTFSILLPSFLIRFPLNLDKSNDFIFPWFVLLLLKKSYIVKGRAHNSENFWNRFKIKKKCIVKSRAGYIVKEIQYCTSVLKTAFILMFSENGPHLAQSFVKNWDEYYDWSQVKKERQGVYILSLCKVP